MNVCLTGKKPLSNTAKKIAAVAAVGVAATAVGVLAAPVIAGAALGAAGFTSAGVAAGSVAAGVQSAVYGGSVAAESLFALCQSAGATGVIGSAATAFIGGGTGLAGIAGTLGSFKLFVRLDCLRNLYSNISRQQQNSTTTKLKWWVWVHGAASPSNRNIFTLVEEL